MFLTIEVKAYGNYPLRPTELLCINTNSISNIEKLNDDRIWFSAGQNNFSKSFKTKEEKNNYFDYIASKLEVLELPKIISFQKREKKS